MAVSLDRSPKGWILCRYILALTFATYKAKSPFIYEIAIKPGMVFSIRREKALPSRLTLAHLCNTLENIFSTKIFLSLASRGILV
jgi:hypothetical protein